MNNFIHIPVLLGEALNNLNVVIGKKYIDATLGGGGHTGEIVKRGGLVLGIDQDADALEYVKKSRESSIRNQALRIVKGNFREIKSLAIENGFEKVDGILFDFGVSSYQLDNSERGFSLKHDEVLDMRMDKNQQLNAYDVINNYPKEKLVEIFYKYGEEHNAKAIADEIVERRKKSKIKTTKELADLVAGIPHKNEPINPATRTFQAIRIEVNDELGAIRDGVVEGLGLLNPGGRIVAISFHSLEDRIIKQLFEGFKRQNLGTVLTKKPLTAEVSEIMKNKRSRSAKMRVFEKN